MNQNPVELPDISERFDLKFRIGISGWTYPPWRGVFYPKGLVQAQELSYASRRFNSIEINGTHYALQFPSSFEKWHDQTPDGFVFSIKSSRFITHIKRLAASCQLGADDHRPTNRHGQKRKRRLSHVEPDHWFRLVRTFSGERHIR